MAKLLAKILSNNNFLSLANNGLVAVLAFFSFLLLVRSLPTEAFGEWVLFITTLNFLDMLRFGITRTALVRFLSGADDTESRQLIGSNYVINGISTIILMALVIVIDKSAHDSLEDSGFSLFFIWFPAVALASLPFNNAFSVLQAKMRFDLILLLRMVNVGSFLIFVVLNYFIFRADLNTIAWVYLVTNIITSILAIIYNWDGIRYTFKATLQKVRVILNFGKYTSGTLIGSNLLKSADTFIIGLSPFLGPTGVALYSIPLKLTEIIEIPIRSFAMTAFPGMSRASIEGNKELVMHIFYRNAGGMFLLMVPVMLVSFLLSTEFVTILGGTEYVETAGIFQIFCIYGLLLPIDRFIGVALDSINRPKQNFIKVVYMTVSNIIGDTIVVFGLFHIILLAGVLSLVFSSGNMDLGVMLHKANTFAIVSVLELVAIVTILFTLIGIAVGFYYLSKEVTIKYTRLITEGWKFYSTLITKVTHTANG